MATKSVKSTDKKSKGFTGEERAAMRDRAGKVRAATDEATIGAVVKKAVS